MREAQDKAAPYIMRIKGQRAHFGDYWAKGAEKLTESLAERQEFGRRVRSEALAFAAETFVTHDNLQRYFGALDKFAHVNSRFHGRKRRWKAACGTPINPWARSACSQSVSEKEIHS